MCRCISEDHGERSGSGSKSMLRGEYLFLSKRPAACEAADSGWVELALDPHHTMLHVLWLPVQGAENAH